jgi:hypothetical protein
VISLLGATPFFVDIDPQTFNLDPEKQEQAVRWIAENSTGEYHLPQSNASLTARRHPRR